MSMLTVELKARLFMFEDILHFLVFSKWFFIDYLNLSTTFNFFFSKFKEKKAGNFSNFKNPLNFWLYFFIKNSQYAPNNFNFKDFSTHFLLYAKLFSLQIIFHRLQLECFGYKNLHFHFNFNYIHRFHFNLSALWLRRYQWIIKVTRHVITAKKKKNIYVEYYQQAW